MSRRAQSLKPKLRRLDIARMVSEEPPPVPWIIDGLIVKGQVTVLNGREGEKKSLLAMALAAGVATGRVEAGFTCHHGKVAIVDAENGQDEIHRRVHTLGLPDEGVTVDEADGLDLRHDLYDLERLLDAESPDLLILDSFRSLWHGDENDSGEVAEVLDPIRELAHRFKAAILLLHHSGKVTGAYRGSSAIGACSELGFKLAHEENDPDPDRCYLECWKCRPAPKPLRRWLDLRVEGGQVFMEEAEPFEGVAADRPAPVREELTPQVLGALTDAPQKRADIARKVGRSPKDRSVGRVLDKLVEDGVAEHTDEGWKKGGRVAPPIGDLPPATPNGTVRERSLAEWQRREEMSR